MKFPKYYDYFTMPEWLAQHVEDFASNLGEVEDGECYIINNVDEGLRMVCRIEPMPGPNATPDVLPPETKDDEGRMAPWLCWISKFGEA